MIINEDCLQFVQVKSSEIHYSIRKGIESLTVKFEDGLKSWRYSPEEIKEWMPNLKEINFFCEEPSGYLIPDELFDYHEFRYNLKFGPKNRETQNKVVLMHDCKIYVKDKFNDGFK